MIALSCVATSHAQAPLAHWAYRQIGRPAVPAIRRNAAWVRNPVDAFVLARQEAAGLTPSPPAARGALLRRLHLDLTGLPPSPEQVREFDEDRRPYAFERRVRELLASPHYGERWAQHWLDVVRFAETNGFELDGEREQAWRYRDYVVRALNADLPYDEFIRHQLAGDELALLAEKAPGASGKWSKFDLQVATGFLRAGPAHIVGGNQDAAVNRQEWLTEAVNGISSALLGVTIHCARCHDHRYDPISQKDYYRLQAFLAAANNTEVRHETPEEQHRFSADLRAHKERLAPIQAEISGIEKPYRDRLRAGKLARLEPRFASALATPAANRTPEQVRLAGEAQTMLSVPWDELVAALSPDDRRRRAELRKRLHAIELEAPTPLPIAAAVTDSLKPVPASRLLFRGDPGAPRDEVQPVVPAALSGYAPGPAIEPIGDRSTGRRLALARWIADPKNRLTGRVIVNRVWRHHFGRGLVETPNDFGKNGRSPTHPELLDWLASWFTAPEGQGAGWSLKRLHELLVTSNTYRQASSAARPGAKKDPENRLLWRMNRPRLDAEAVRDSVLTAAGTLNPAFGGRPIKVPLEPEVYDTIFTEGEPDNLWPVHPDPREHTRRSLYLLRKRNVRLPMFVALDSPDMMKSCGAREESVHSLQALTLLNSDFMTQQSRALARRVLSHADDSGRIRALFILTLSRPPTRVEHEDTGRFLRANLDDGLTVEAAYSQAALALLNSNEFAYRP